jgi:hypothetical protein
MTIILSLLTHPFQRENQEQYLSKMEINSEKINNLSLEFEQEKKEYLSSLPPPSVSVSTPAAEKEKSKGGHTNESIRTNMFTTTERFKSVFR